MMRPGATGGRGRPRGLAALVALALCACAAAGALAADTAASRVPKPTVAIATPGKCVEDTPFMLRNHMELLKHHRDRTVHEGVRTTQHSLANCVNCHASPQTGRVTGSRDALLRGLPPLRGGEARLLRVPRRPAGGCATRLPGGASMTAAPAIAAAARSAVGASAQTSEARDRAAPSAAPGAAAVASARAARAPSRRRGRRARWRRASRWSGSLCEGAHAPRRAASNKVRWGMLVDVNRCASDCDACVTACDKENGLPAVEVRDVGAVDPQGRAEGHARRRDEVGAGHVPALRGAAVRRRVPDRRVVQARRRHRARRPPHAASAAATA